MQAVATVIAANTPIDACTRCGINDLVFTTPPFIGFDIRVILGTDFLVTSPSSMRLPACSRIDSIADLTSAFTSNLSRLSRPVIPKSDALMITQGIPLSINVHSTPSRTSITLPVGINEPQFDPARFEKNIGIAAAAPGTPSIVSSPS